jgi:hypothetical protein
MIAGHSSETNRCVKRTSCIRNIDRKDFLAIHINRSPKVHLFSFSFHLGFIRSNCSSIFASDDKQFLELIVPISYRLIRSWFNDTKYFTGITIRKYSVIQEYAKDLCFNIFLIPLKNLFMLYNLYYFV